MLSFLAEYLVFVILSGTMLLFLMYLADEVRKV